MSKELFDAVVGTPPPSTVDIRAIMRRRRRIIAARRIGTSITSAVAVVALGVIGAVVRDQDHPASQLGSNPTDVSAPMPSPESLRTALAAAVAARVPDGIWMNDYQPPTFTAPPQPSVSCLDCDPGGVRISPPSSDPILLTGSGVLSRFPISGPVTLRLLGGQSALTCDVDSCATGTTPTGARLAIRWTRTARGHVIKREVTVELPGGRALTLIAEASNGDLAAGTVLTEAELRDIATDVVAQITA